MTSSIRPNFFIVGAAKAGTSSLHACLAQHPQVFMSQRKELSFFSTDLDLPHRVKTLDAYLSHFEAGRDQPIRGEASVSYLLSGVAATSIREFAPDARILISLRDPVQALVSQHAEMRRWGTERHRDVNQALADFGQPRRKRRSGPEYEAFAGVVDQLMRYLDTFAREQVKVIVYEEWTAAPEREIPSILSFLDVDTSNVPPLSRLRPGTDFRSQWVQRAVMTPPRWLSPIVDAPAGRRLRAKVMRANVDARPRRPLLDTRQAELRELFRPEVDQLGQLLGRDLARLWWSSADRPTSEQPIPHQGPTVDRLN